MCHQAGSAAGKNVGRRPQFSCGVRKGASGPALRSGRFLCLPSRPQLPAHEFPRSRRAGLLVGGDASAPHRRSDADGPGLCVTHAARRIDSCLSVQERVSSCSLCDADRGAAGCVSRSMRAVSAPAKPKAPARPAARRTGPAQRSSCGREHLPTGVRDARPARAAAPRKREMLHRCSCAEEVVLLGAFAVVTGVLLDAVRLPRVLTEACAAKSTRRAPSGRIRRGKMWAAARNSSCGVRKGGSRRLPPRIAVGAIPEPAIRTAAAGARVPAQPPCRLLVGVRRQRPALVMRHRRPGPLDSGRGLRSHRLPAMPAAAAQWPPSRILARYADSHVLEGGHQ